MGKYCKLELRTGTLTIQDPQKKSCKWMVRYATSKTKNIHLYIKIYKKTLYGGEHHWGLNQ